MKLVLVMVASMLSLGAYCLLAAISIAFREDTQMFWWMICLLPIAVIPHVMAMLRVADSYEKPKGKGDDKKE